MARFLFSFGDDKFFGRWDPEMQKYLEEHYDFPTTFSKWYEWDHKPDVGEEISLPSLWFSPFRVVEVKHQLEGPDAGVEIVIKPIREHLPSSPPMTRAYLEELAKLEWMADYKPIKL